METHNLTAARTRKSARTEILGVRLTPQEREQINQLAHHLRLRPSRMVRQFVLQAVAFCAEQSVLKGPMDDRS